MNLLKLPKKNIFLYNRKGETRLYLFLAFIIPFLIIWGIFAYFQIHPFGDQQILVVDLWHQYFPFFREEHEKLQNMDSLLYSWNTGLGTNFLSVMSYYAASPLNLLSVFFPLESSRDAMTLFLTVKMGCASLFFAIFLKHHFGRNDISIAAFGLFYAFCDYMMGYYWNLIWMDTFALLPLVVLGAVKLVREGKFKLFTITLAISLVSNFYIGLFTCIFTAMIFLASVIINWKNFKTALIRLGQMAGASALGVGLGAFMLLPAFFALMLTNSADNTFPTVIEYYEEWLKMMSNMIGFHEPTSKEGLPNFYCGMFAVILIGVFLISKKIKLREKFITVAYLMFIVISCNMNVLNFIWHGFHFTNMLPYRFSFLFSFLLAAAAYRAFTVITDKASIFHVLAMSVMTLFITLVSYRDQPETAVMLSVITCVLYTAIVFIYERKIINKRIMLGAVSLVCCAEMGYNAFIGVQTVTTTGYDYYPKNNEQVEALLEKRSDETTDLYRTELCDSYTINDPALYGIKGMSQFSSTANVNVTRFLGSLGIQASDAGNRYYYYQSTPIINSMFDIKYLISHDGFEADTEYYSTVAEKGQVKLLENNSTLPIAFAANKKVLNYMGESGSYAANQNDLFSYASGVNKDVLVQLNVADVGHKGLDVVKTEEGCYNFTYKLTTDGLDECYIKYNYEAQQDGPVYALVKFDHTSGYKVSKNGSYLHNMPDFKYNVIAAIGSFKKGDRFTIYSDIDKETSGSGKIFVYQINNEVFNEGLSKLRDGALNVTSYDSTHISGDFTARKDGVLFTSIPYDGGWSAEIDGEKAEVRSIKDALCCIPVTAGKHEIKLVYSPPGFTAGCIISFTSLILFIAAWYVQGVYRKKHPVSSEQQTYAAQESEEIIETDGTEDTDTAAVSDSSAEQADDKTALQVSDNESPVENHDISDIPDNDIKTEIETESMKDTENTTEKADGNAES